MADLEISEFASIPSKQLEKLLEQWKYSKVPLPTKEELEYIGR